MALEDDKDRMISTIERQTIETLVADSAAFKRCSHEFVQAKGEVFLYFLVNPDQWIQGAVSLGNIDSLIGHIEDILLKPVLVYKFVPGFSLYNVDRTKVRNPYSKRKQFL